MAALTPTNSTTQSVQSSLLRARADSARRQADQAESQAKALREQAQEQEQVMVQSRTRAQSLEQNAGQTLRSAATQPASSTVASTSKAKPANSDTVVVDQRPTYAGVLAGVFAAAKPILDSSLNSAQKNLVKSELFDTSQRMWRNAQSPAQVQRSYGVQALGTLQVPAGQVINTAA